MAAALSLPRLLAYAAPAFPLAVLTLPLYIVLPAFYAGELGVPLAVVGQVLLLVRLFDGLNDPVVGFLADRSGRRRTWFLSGVPVTMVAAWCLFVPPAGAGAGWLGLFGALLSLGTTLCLIPYWAWGAELEDDYHGRSRVTGLREAVVVAGTLVATATPALAEALGAAGDGPALLALAVVVAVLLPATAVLAAAVVPEPPRRARTGASLSDGLRAMARNGPFLRLLAAFLVNGLANGLPATLFLFFVSERLQAPDWAGLILFAYFLAAVAGVPLALALARRIGKHRAWGATMLAASAVFALAPLLGPGDAPLFLAVAVLTGLALGADLALPASIQADVLDVDRAASGADRGGAYFAAWGLATKLALALAVGIAFPVLDLAGFDPAGGPQAETALAALALLYAGVPVVLKLAAVALMWRFPLGEAEQRALRARIAAAQPLPVTPATAAK